MNNKTLISALTLTTVMGATLALPTTASAHEVVHEKRVVILQPSVRHEHERRAQPERWYLERHREASSAWAPPRHRYPHEEKHAHRHDHRQERVEYREYRPVAQPRDYRSHDHDALRIRIGYDILL